MCCFVRSERWAHVPCPAVFAIRLIEGTIDEGVLSESPVALTDLEISHLSFKQRFDEAPARLCPAQLAEE